MSNTHIKSVYLAQAIDLRDEKAASTVKWVKSSLLCAQVVTFDPSEAFHLANVVQLKSEESEQGEYIFGVNLFAFKAADLRVFVYTGSPSWGMPIELFMAVERGLPFVFLDFTNTPHTPVYLRELFNIAGADRFDIETCTPFGSIMEDFIDQLVRGLMPDCKTGLRIWATPIEDSDESQG